MPAPWFVGRVERSPTGRRKSHSRLCVVLTSVCSFQFVEVNLELLANARREVERKQICEEVMEESVA